MSFFFLYLAKLSLSLAAVFLFYRLVLRRLTFFNWNRWYLLVFTTGCFFIPLVDISSLAAWHTVATNKMVQAIPSFGLPVAALHADTINSSQAILLTSLAKYILFGGMAVLLFRLAFQYFSFRKLKRNAVLINRRPVKIYSVAANIIPFSIGNAIFIQQNLQYCDGIEEIIRHEFVHVKQQHSIDILFTELLCIVNWYNPFAWLIKHSVRQNLEFIVDNKIVETGCDKKEYQYLLLKVMGSAQFSFAQQFNFSSLKKRIIMMNKSKTTRLQLVRFLAVLPLAALLLLAFRHGPTPVVTPSATDIHRAAVTDTLPGTINNITVQKNKATVTLIDGNVERYNLNNQHEKALFVKKYGELPAPPAPPPPPQAVAPAAPAAPPAPPAPPAVEAPAVAPPPPVPAPPARAAITPTPSLPPLYVVDGREMPPGTDIEKIPSADIERVDVLKGDQAVAAYSDKGKSGVVKVTMKNTVARSTNKFPDNLLVIVDGKQSSKKERTAIDPQLVDSVTILKGPAAVKLYGDKGKNGAIIVTSKIAQAK